MPVSRCWMPSTTNPGPIKRPRERRGRSVIPLAGPLRRWEGTYDRRGKADARIERRHSRTNATVSKLVRFDQASNLTGTTMEHGFTPEHFALLETWKGTPRQTGNPAQDAARDAIIDAYEATARWARAINARLFPRGYVRKRSDPFGQNQLFQTLYLVAHLSSSRRAHRPRLHRRN